MTALTLQPLTRRFKIASLEIPDPAPHLSPTEAVKLLAASYPPCAHGLLGDPEERDGLLIYPVEKMPVKTNG